MVVQVNEKKSSVEAKIIATILLITLIFSLPFIIPTNQGNNAGSLNNLTNNSIPDLLSNSSVPPQLNSTGNFSITTEEQSTISSNITYKITQINNKTYLVELSIPVKNPHDNESVTISCADPSIRFMTVKGSMVKNITTRVNGMGAYLKFYLINNNTILISSQLQVMLQVELSQNNNPVDMSILTLNLK